MSLQKMIEIIKEKSVTYYKISADFLQKNWHAYKKYRKNKKPLTIIEKMWKWFGISVVSIFIYFFLVEINFLWLFGASPSLDKLQNPQLDQPSALYTADGVLLGRYYRENRSPVPYKKISPFVVKALIATEDVRFNKHSGIDVKGLFSAFFSVLQGDGRGASTLSQQLAKNLYKTRQKQSEGILYHVPFVKTLVIKTKEWLTAIKLERLYTKQEILTLYLNTVDFGSNAYGIKTASRTFFDTSPDSLSIQEAALLIGLLKAPTQYSPILNPKNAVNRRNVVFSQMVKYGVLTSAQKDSLSKLPLKLDYHVETHIDGADTYFRGSMNKFLSEWCEENGFDLYTSGLKIYTTIDSRIQAHAEKAVAEQVKFQQGLFNSQWGNENPWRDQSGKEIANFIETVAKRTEYYKYLKEKYKNNQDSIDYWMNKPKTMKVFSWNGEKEMVMSSMDSIRYYKKFLQAGMMSMDPFTGHIKAWVGGIDYKYFKYDHVKQGKRQPGSTFKPFVYTAAIDNGWSPCDEIQDKMVTIKYEENGEKKEWTPKNADWVYSGRNMTLRHALGRSINTVTAQLTEKVTPEKVVEYAKKMGINSDIKPVPSVGLGSSDVNIYDMVSAYAIFANQGIWTEPMLITRIEDRYGNILHQFTPNQKRVLSPETAWLMLYMLKGGIEEPLGTSQNLWSFNVFGNNNEFAAKTGTSSNQSDAWFMAITKDLVSGVWFGADDRSIHFRSMLGEGARTALPIFGTYIEKLYADKDLDITRGPLPKAPAYVKKKYYCPTLWVPTKRDSVAADSLGNIPTELPENLTTPADSTRQ
jgi:penicillin-binding protein 1A